MHESNTFAPGATTLDDFLIARRAELVADVNEGDSVLSGFAEVLKKHDVECVALLSAKATPGAPVAADALDKSGE